MHAHTRIRYFVVDTIRFPPLIVRTHRSIQLILGLVALHGLLHQSICLINTCNRLSSRLLFGIRVGSLAFLALLCTQLHHQCHRASLLRQPASTHIVRASIRVRALRTSRHCFVGLNINITLAGVRAVFHR